MISSNVAKFTYGPMLRWARNQSIKRQYDKEPEWRQAAARSLDSGYQKRW